MTAIESSVHLAVIISLFTAVGLIFLFANLLVGRLVRPADPHEEKQEIYECGEPTIGSSFVQFDLRFYVVALLFIIFDVEVAFFFPWATVFGKSVHLSELGNKPAAVVTTDGELTKTAKDLYRELGVANPKALPETTEIASLGTIDATGSKRQAEIVEQGGLQLAWLTIVDICVFFAVLLVGFLYVWKRGDLDWVRAVSQERAKRRAPDSGQETPQVLSV